MVEQLLDNLMLLFSQRHDRCSEGIKYHSSNKCDPINNEDAEDTFISPTVIHLDNPLLCKDW